MGDTPESDIRGANEADEQSTEDAANWYSILVRTGVYIPGTTPRYQPKATVDTVLDAVRHGIEREAVKERKLAGTKSPIAEASPGAEEAAEKSLDSFVARNGVGLLKA